MPQLLFFAASRSCIRLSAARSANESALQAQTAYVVQLDREADAQLVHSLAQLLDAAAADAPAKGWLVLPHPGMQSSFAGKAQAIAASCGLSGITLLECAAWHTAERPTCDRMLETAVPAADLQQWLEAAHASRPAAEHAQGRSAVELASDLRLALDEAELQRLTDLFARLQRAPTPAEVLLLAQTNSEHCRHKTFRARIAGCGPDTPLFASIRATHRASPERTLVAYDDNAAVVELGIRRAGGTDELMHTVLKAETHNHPTGISPYPGAATGVGGEIRDEAAAGRGAASHAGFAGYILSDLHLPAMPEPWEASRKSFPNGMAEPLQVLIDAPLGAAAFGNEFGRPLLAGFLRTCELRSSSGEHLGFHKPAMIAGGMGEIGANAIAKLPVRSGDLLVQLGGPGMRIGVSGGAAASTAAGSAPDYASVQRDSAEMQRRAQEAIDACRNSSANPLRALHDVGAGGLGNALAELAASSGCDIRLAAMPVGQADLSPAEILCNEAQERFVAAVAAADLPALEDICRRERCPLAVLGTASDHKRMRVLDEGGGCVVDLPIADLFGGDAERVLQAALPAAAPAEEGSLAGIGLAEAARRVLRHPAVADKSFLITIADRTVGGLTARDQLVGPWQTAVADCAVTYADHCSSRGRAMALGERPAVAAANPAASARMAIAEAIFNLAAADVAELAHIRLSLNWMAACDAPEPAGELVAGVRAVCDQFLPELGISVPAGKDSLAMRARWKQEDGSGNVRSPLTCVCSAFAPVDEAERTLTPQMSATPDTVLLLLRASDQRRMGMSVLAQAFAVDGACAVPDIDARGVRTLWDALRAMREQGIVLAYHDLSDGGLFAAAAEMAFAGNCGATLVLDALCQPQMGIDADGCEQRSDATSAGGIERILRELFCEEIGAIVQVERKHAAAALSAAQAAGLDANWPQTIGWPNADRRMRIMRNGTAVLDESIDELRRQWSALGAQVRALRDDEACAAQEAERDFASDRGLFVRNIPQPAARSSSGKWPAAVVLREQGTNGQREMAAALDAAGFAVRIIAMSELAQDPQLLDDAKMLALPGGFSYGDALGAGRGQAQAILQSDALRTALSSFFARETLTLGICNGCQVLSQLAELLPEQERCAFPQLLPNRSRRFEARLCMVEILDSPSILLKPLAGALLPVPVSCGEGRAVYAQDVPASTRSSAALRFVDHEGAPAELHPLNPTGAAGGLCGFCTPNGRITLLMPHPERAVRAGQLAWILPGWSGSTPWLRIFAAARDWCTNIALGTE